MQTSPPHPSHRILLAFGILCCLALDIQAETRPPSNEQLWAEADARIEQHRQAHATGTVRDAAGKPVAGATVRVEQIRHAFLFGSNIFLWGQVGDEASEAAYRRRFAEVFNYATLPFYWPMYESRRGQPRHERTEHIARWCQEQGILCKGHPLAWNFAEPGWLPDDAGQIHALQLGRIEDCVARFKGLIDRWDVVNEATHFDRAEFAKRAPKLTGMWAQVGQLPFTRDCFRQARQAHPQATLLINDYRVDTAYERVIEQLVDEQGRRWYDVIGIQSHQHGGTWDNRKIWDVCERFARFGVPLHYTETTIVSGQKGWELGQAGKSWPSTPEGEAEQAREVERFFTLLYSHPAVEAITWWDFSDRGAWQRAPAGFLRADMSPKPAYEVLRKLVKDKWWTRHSLTTDQDGRFKFRGTCGDYRLTVQRPGQPDFTAASSLARAGRNDFSVEIKSREGEPIR